MRFTFSPGVVFTASSLACTLLLSACSSTPAATKQATVNNPVVVAEAPKVEETPETLIARAKTQWHNNHDEVARNQLLLDAVDIYLFEKQTAKAQHILKSLQSEALQPAQRIRANLYIARAYSQTPNADLEKLLTLLSPLSADDPLRHQQLALQTQFNQQLHHYLAAANSFIQLAEPNEQTVSQLWQWVNMASDSERQQADNQYPLLRPYLALHELLASNGLDSRALQEATDQFKHVYRGHPLVTYWPSEIAQATALQLPHINDIAVLLPLQGRLEATGMAIKEGILASYYQTLNNTSVEQAAPQLRFIDTTDKTPEALVEAIGESRFIIGPLLKETVQALAPRLPAGVTMLALNRPDDVPVRLSDSAEVTNRQAYFSLAPEDEAIQLAEHIFRNGYRAPIVVSSQNAINQRMLEAFQQRWQRLNSMVSQGKQVNITSVTFSDSSSLRDGITAALDVAQSKDRIDQIRYMVNEELYNVPRNRRDIDAIVVFATPEQTELLNPMVEASLSPFTGKTVPVYATSRSMEYDSSKNQWRDLQNVRFLDMPWMLPGNPWRSLKAETDKLWPQRNTQLSRLFAFGVDAYNLIPYLDNLATLPQTAFSGLTGSLSMNRQQEIVRDLPQAVIDNEQVKQVTR